MRPSKPLLENHIGFRVSQEVFEQIQMRADRAGKPANAWCREKVIEAAARPRVTLAEFAILAEVIAVEEMIVNLLYAIVTEGKPPLERFRQITGKAHAAKQNEARKLLEDSKPWPEASQSIQPPNYPAPVAKG